MDQYSSYVYWGQHIDGANTLGENIADQGGVNNGACVCVYVVVSMSRAYAFAGAATRGTSTGRASYTNLPPAAIACLGIPLSAYEVAQDNDWPTEQLMHDLTNEQLFFLKLGQTWCTIDSEDSIGSTMADVHSPGKFRIIGPLSNYRAYADAFSCDASTLMGRSKTDAGAGCLLWSD